MRRYKNYLFALCLGLFTACNQTPSAAPAQRVVPPEGSVVVSKSTKVLSPSVVQQITSFSKDTGKLRFRRSGGLQTSQVRDPLEIEDPAQLQPGDVINAGISDSTPYGLLQQVTNVTTTGDEVVVDTQPVPIEQVVQDGQIENVETPFTVDQAALAQLQSSGGRTPGNATTQALTIAGFRYQTGFQNVDLSGGTGNVLASGNLDWNATIKMDIGFRWFRLNLFKTFVELDASERFTLNGPRPASNLDYTVVLARLPGRPIQLSIPIFDAGVLRLRFKIVITPYLEIRMNLRGETSAQVYMNYTRQDTYQAGIEWTGNNGWQPVKSHVIRANSLSVLPTNANLKFGMGPAVGFVFYGGLEIRFLFFTFTIGLANANVSVVMLGFVKLDANSTRTPQWILSGGLEAVANAQGSIVGFGFNHTTPLFSIERRLASGNFGLQSSDPNELLTPNVSQLEPGSVGLTWPTISGSSSYRVERSSDGETYSTLADGTGMTLTDTSVQPGATYFYRVSAMNSSGVAGSGMITVTAPRPPRGDPDPCQYRATTQNQNVTVQRPRDPPNC